MAKARIVLEHSDPTKFYGIEFRCPGCAASTDRGSDLVVLPVRWCPEGLTRSGLTVGRDGWDFNGNFDLPTFNPSVLSHFDMPEEDGYPAVHFVCHSFVRDGKIQFLGDCTHALAGQTVDLPELPE